MDDKMYNRITALWEKQDLAAQLVEELAGIVALREMGIERHDIVKQRPVTTYTVGKRLPTGMTEIIMRDGTKHTVPTKHLKGV